MPSTIFPAPAFPVDLGGGLILRQSNAADLEPLAEFNNQIHFFVPEHERTIRAMTRDLLTGRCPAFKAHDFTVVIDQSNGKIVSSLALIAQTWSYAGIPFGVGRPELVGTHPDYRGRGLVRAQFQVLHQRCQWLGLPVQAITGIPYYYRQFGYDMALPSGGGCMGYTPQQLPGLAEGEQEHFSFRPAEEKDLEWIAPLYQSCCSRYQVSCQRSMELWQYELSGKSSDNIHKMELWVISTLSSQPAGFLLCHKTFGPVEGKTAVGYELLPGFSWSDVSPAVLRFLYADGQQDALAQGGSCAHIGLDLGTEHPAYSVVSPWLSIVADPGVWYVRVADLPDFLNRISPVLQQRVSVSGYSSFTGHLRINLYHSAFQIDFEQGIIQKIQPYKVKDWEDAQAAFPYLSFLQLLFGFRSLKELQYAYPDCWCHPDKAELLQALFPKVNSNVWGLA
jgi:hypothetical protein